MTDQKTEEAKKLFASRLKAKLAERHMNQNTLAELLGMSESSIGKWTLGKSMPRTMGQIEKIASIFNVEKSYFLEENLQAPAPAADPMGLTARDERDIERRLDAIMNDLAPGTGLAFYDGQKLTDSERDLLRISLKNSMELVRSMAKERFTPKKYKK